MTLAYTGSAATGALHGTWTTENTITQTSDRRLKKNIRPLYQEMAKAMTELGGEDNVDFTS